LGGSDTPNGKKIPQNRRALAADAGGAAPSFWSDAKKGRASVAPDPTKKALRLMILMGVFCDSMG
jgi:hypothetical protein